MTNLRRILAKKSGRGAKGHITTRHQGGRHKRYLREIDFKRKRDVWGKVQAIEYDPNRGARLALILYEDGDKKYILCPEGLKLGQKVIASENAPIEPGNALPLIKIPVGTQVHALEIMPGKGAQIVRGAGNVAVIQGREENWILVSLPSGELRRFRPNSWATVGQVGLVQPVKQHLGRAGRTRRMGIRPTVRGVAMHPAAHPHGGGEGRSGIGMKYPKTPFGKPAVGKTRKKRRYSSHLIVQKRKAGPHVG